MINVLKNKKKRELAKEKAEIRKENRAHERYLSQLRVKEAKEMARFRAFQKAENNVNRQRPVKQQRHRKQQQLYIKTILIKTARLGSVMHENSTLYFDLGLNYRLIERIT